MGRTISADESVEKYIHKLLLEKKWYMGVMIGHLSSSRGYVVKFAKTPDPAEDEASEDNGEAGDFRRKPAVVQPDSLEKMEEKWVSTHAKQVSRMLPGGLSVVGLFAIAPANMLQRSQSELKKMLFAIHRVLSKNQLSTETSQPQDRLLFQLDNTTSKISCSSIDVTNGKSAFKPAEWKVQRGSTKWVQLNSQISINLPFGVTENLASQGLLKQIKAGLSDYGTQIERSVISIDGQLRDPSEPLVPKTKGKEKRDDTQKHDVSIYTPCTIDDTHPDPEHRNSASCMRIFGQAKVRGFVPAKSVVAEAVEAIKEDILRSLSARCELLCEEYDVTDNLQENEVFDPPIRLFAKLPDTDIDVCDYVFQDEQQTEVLTRMRDLLDTEVTTLEEVEKRPACIESTWTNEEVIPPELQHTAPVSTDDSSTANKSSTSYIGMMTAAVMAFLAAGFSYFYVSGTE